MALDPTVEAELQNLAELGTNVFQADVEMVIAAWGLHAELKWARWREDHHIHFEGWGLESLLKMIHQTAGEELKLIGHGLAGSKVF